MESSVMHHTPISKNNFFSSVLSEPSPTISEKLRRSWPSVKFTFRIWVIVITFIVLYTFCIYFIVYRKYVQVVYSILVQHTKCIYIFISDGRRWKGIDEKVHHATNANFGNNSFSSVSSEPPPTISEKLRLEPRFRPSAHLDQRVVWHVWPSMKLLFC
jgi:hypothetical protein